MIRTTLLRYLLPLVLVVVTVPAGAAETRDVTGSASYRERIALPPGAELVVEATGFEKTPLAAERYITNGEQVPLPFRLTLPADVRASLQVSILMNGKTRWMSERHDIPPGHAPYDLGDILLKGYVASDFAHVMTCIDRTFRLEFEDGMARLDTGESIIELPQTISASGARFESADGRVMIWNKGAKARVKIDDREYVECDIRAAETAGWTARGNEPGWLVAIKDGRASFTLNYGSETLDLPLPAPTIESGAYRYEFPRFALTLTVQDGMCEDDMSGRPYPQKVELTTATERLRGCGGETMDLLTGAEWQVEDVDGQRLVDNSHITISVTGEGNIAGTSGCNGYGGNFTIDGEGKITIGPLVGTMMACAEPLMKQEHAFLQALSSVNRFRIDETGALLLMVDDRAILTARR